MVRLVIFLLGSLLLVGCGQKSYDHYAKVAEARAALPRVYHVSEYSHSMIPVINPGDLIICNPFPWEKLESGMDVLYWPVGSSVPVCHRLRIKIAQGLWEAHGINNPVNDPWYVSKENYLGVVVKQ